MWGRLAGEFPAVPPQRCHFDAFIWFCYVEAALTCDVAGQ